MGRKFVLQPLLLSLSPTETPLSKTLILPARGLLSSLTDLWRWYKINYVRVVQL